MRAMRLAEPKLRLFILALAATLIAQGLWLALSPGTFYDALANFGARSDHGLRDTAAFPLAAGVCLWIAADRPSWRVPALALTGLQIAIHSVNHLIDIADSDPGWVGPFDFVTLAGMAVVAFALMRAAQEQEVAR